MVRSPVVRAARRMALLALVALLAFPSASATHFRGGSIYAIPDPGANGSHGVPTYDANGTATYPPTTAWRFTGWHAARIGYWDEIHLGDILPLPQESDGHWLHGGDGGKQPLALRVTAINPIDDWFMAEILPGPLVVPPPPPPPCTTCVPPPPCTTCPPPPPPPPRPCPDCAIEDAKTPRLPGLTPISEAIAAGRSHVDPASQGEAKTASASSASSSSSSYSTASSSGSSSSSSSAGAGGPVIPDDESVSWEGYPSPYPYSNAQYSGVQWAACCRLGDQTMNEHIDNPQGGIQLLPTLDAGKANAPPEPLIPPIVQCFTDSICKFPVPAIDPDGDAMEWSLASSWAAGGGEWYDDQPAFIQPGPAKAPNEIAVDPTTGMATWDTHGAGMAIKSGARTFYSTQVVIREVGQWVQDLSDETGTTGGFGNGAQSQTGNANAGNGGSSSSAGNGGSTAGGANGGKGGGSGSGGKGNGTAGHSTPPAKPGFVWKPLDHVSQATPVDFLIELKRPALPPIWARDCQRDEVLRVGQKWHFEDVLQAGLPGVNVSILDLGTPRGLGVHVTDHGSQAFVNLTWSPGEVDLGHHLMVVMGEDETGLQAPFCVLKLWVRMPNQPPMLKAIKRLEVEVGTHVSFTVGGFDPDDDTPLAFSTLQWPQAATFDPLTRSFDWTPRQAGVYDDIAFRVTDPYGATGDGNGEIDVFERVEDLDHDGVQDFVDDCPGVPDFAQADFDGDGIGDLCDTDTCHAGGQRTTTAVAPAPCPGTPAGKTKRALGNDFDSDGVPDRADDCPAIADPGQSNLDNDRYGDACDDDLDGDGMPQAARDASALLDNCPTRSNPDQRDRDGDGIGDACSDAADSTAGATARGGRAATAGDARPASASADAAAKLPAAQAGGVALGAVVVGLVVAAAFLGPRRR